MSDGGSRGASFATVVEQLQLLIADSSADHAVMVGIGGHGASGKSTLARTLADTLEVDTQIVGTDEFWTGLHFDLDRVRSSVVEPVANGMCGHFKSWHWASQKFIGERTISPSGLVIVEGVCALHRMFREHYAYRVWVEAPYETRVARGVARDGEEMRDTWVNVWIPNEEAYVSNDDPLSCTDAIIDGTQPYS